MNDQPAKKAKAATLESKVLQKSNESEEKGNFSDVKPLKENMWVASTWLNWKAHDQLKESRMLQDLHFQLAHTLIRKQFGIDGCQSTLLFQNGNFLPVCDYGMIFVIHK